MLLIVKEILLTVSAQGTGIVMKKAPSPSPALFLTIPIPWG